MDVMKLAANAHKITAANCFPDTIHNSSANKESHHEIKTVLSSQLHNDEPQYSFHKVSSFGSSYRLSQVSFLHSHQSHHTNRSNHSNYELVYKNHCSNYNNNIINSDRIDEHEYIDVISDADITCIGKNTTDCIALQRIISILVFYSNNYNNYDAIHQYLNVYNMKKHLINDYIHILDKHLNEDNMSKHKSNRQFYIIYKSMIDKSHLVCNIANCSIFQRNHRQRETQQISPVCNDPNIAMFIDILDTIHCYFIHSVDIGYRIINKYSMQIDAEKRAEKHDSSSGDDIYNANDINMKQLREYLHQKHQMLKDKNNRFTTQLLKNTSCCESAVNDIDVNDMEGYLRKESKYFKQLRMRYMVLNGKSLYSYKTDKKKALTEIIDLKIYNHVEISQNGPIGQFELVCDNDKNSKKRVLVAESMDELDDWLKAFKNCIKSLKSDESDRLNQVSVGERYDYWKKAVYPKYESIKEEITNNKIFSISTKTFTDAYLKAKYLLNSCDKIRNLMTCSDVLKKYNFRYDEIIRIDHIIALVLWTDYRKLAQKFRTTFKKISKKIYDEFWIWSKFLIEAVNAFGQRLKKSKCKTCYHNVFDMRSIHSFQITFNVPTSTTTKLQIALLNAPTNDGMVLELGPNDERFTKKMRYFNCSFVSCYANENERLFIQPPNNNYYLFVRSIRNLKTNENYCKYMYAMNILRQLLTNQKIKCNIDLSDVQMINNLIAIIYEKGQRNNANVLDRISKCPQFIKNLLNEWRVNITNITFNYNITFNNKIVQDINIFNDANNVVRFDKLNVMFRNLKSIYIDCAKYNSINHWIDIAKILNNINKLKSSKLTEIYIIHRHHGNMLKKMWNQILKLIKNKKWELIDVESKAICITRAQNV